PDVFLKKVFPDPALLFGDINELMKRANAPIDYRDPTFWEWIRRVDVVRQQVEQKLQAGSYADQLLKQRLAVIGQYLETAQKMQEGRSAALAQHQNELRAELESLRLEEEIARVRTVRDQRLTTEKLEETAKQVRLLNEINPPPEPPKQKDPAKQVIDDHR